MVASKRNIPRSLSSPNAAASHTSPNRHIPLFVSPDKPKRDSSNGMHAQNFVKYKIQDSEKQVNADKITSKMLQSFRDGWHDRALSSSNWRTRVGN